KNHQGNRHHFRRFMQMFLLMMSAPKLSIESHEQQTKHINSCENGSDGKHRENHRRISKTRDKNFILRKETCEWRSPADRKRCNSHRPKCCGKKFSQSSHFAKILLTAHRMNHASCSEK